MQPHYRDAIWANANLAGKAYGQAAGPQAGQLRKPLSPCVLAVTRAYNAAWGTHHDNPEFAQVVVAWGTGRTLRRARSIIKFQMRWGALRLHVPAAQRSTFLRASLRGLRKGGCLVRPTRTRMSRFSGVQAQQYGFAWTPEGGFTYDDAASGDAPESAGGGAGSGNTQSFDPNAFANILSSALGGAGALFGGIGQLHSAVNASGGDANALSPNANAQLQTSANELSQSKSDLAAAILNNDRLAQQMAEDRMNQSIANAGSVVNDEQGSDQGLSTGAWVGIGLGTASVVGLIAFLALRGRGGAANFDYSY